MFASFLRSRQYRPIYDAPKVGTRFVRRPDSPASSLSDEGPYDLEPHTLLLPEEKDEGVNNRKKVTKGEGGGSICNEGEICHKNNWVCTACRKQDCVIL